MDWTAGTLCVAIPQDDGVLQGGLQVTSVVIVPLDNLWGSNERDVDSSLRGIPHGAWKTFCKWRGY